MITQAELKNLIHYDPDTGSVYRLPLGLLVDCKDSCGYVIVKVKGKIYKAHRLAFLFMVGRFPEGDVDHVNMIRSDNRWCNLREATRQQNNVNVRSKPGSSSRFLGVTFSKTHKKWAARIRTSEGRRLLGYFDDEAEAAREYHFAAKVEFGEHARGNPEAFK